MSRFAPVVPLNVARWMKGKGILGNYHLLLAHDVLEHPQEYREVYSGLPGDSCVILDNSVIELGKAMDIDRLMRAAEIIEPEYLVVPDAMGAMEETLTLAEVFTREYYENFGKDTGPELLAVIQGRTIDEHRICAKELAMMPRVKALSVPRITTATLGSRMRVLQSVLRYQPHKMIHLLGFSDDLLDDICCARIPGVAGIDSAVPIRAGFHGLTISLGCVQKEIGPRGSYWNYTICKGDIFEEYITTNMQRIRKWIDTTKHVVD